MAAQRIDDSLDDAIDEEATQEIQQLESLAPRTPTARTLPVYSSTTSSSASSRSWDSDLEALLGTDYNGRPKRSANIFAAGSKYATIARPTTTTATATAVAQPAKIVRSTAAPPRPTSPVKVRTSAEAIKSGQHIMVGKMNVRLIKKVGEGSFGQVWRGLVDGDAPMFVAVKLTSCDGKDAQHCAASNRAIDREQRWLQRCKDYPRIVQMLSYAQCVVRDNEHCRGAIVLEYCDGGDLVQYAGTRSRASLHPMSTPTFIVPPDALPRTQPAGRVLPHARVLNPSQQAADQEALKAPLSHGVYALGSLSGQYNLIREIMDGCARALVQFRIALGTPTMPLLPNGGDGGLTYGTIPTHGDLKYDNFLVQDGVVKIADLGHVRTYDADSEQQVLQAGTSSFQDENMQKAYARGCMKEGVKCDDVVRPGYKVDEFSLGVMLYRYAIDMREPSASVYAAASRLYATQGCNAPLVLEAVIGLTHPDYDARWSVDQFLNSEFMSPLPSVFMATAVGAEPERAAVLRMHRRRRVNAVMIGGRARGVAEAVEGIWSRLWWKLDDYKYAVGAEYAHASVQDRAVAETFINLPLMDDRWYPQADIKPLYDGGIPL